MPKEIFAAFFLSIEGTRATSSLAKVLSMSQTRSTYKDDIILWYLLYKIKFNIIINVLKIIFASP